MPASQSPDPIALQSSQAPENTTPDAARIPAAPTPRAPQDARVPEIPAPAEGSDAVAAAQATQATPTDRGDDRTDAEAAPEEDTGDAARDGAETSTSAEGTPEGAGEGTGEITAEGGRSADTGNMDLLLAQASTSTAGTPGTPGTDAPAPAPRSSDGGTSLIDALFGDPETALGVLGGGAVVLAALDGGGGGSDAPPPAPSGYTLSGSVVAGPLVATHGVSVEAYRADGTLLASTRVGADGRYSLRIDDAYAGVVLLRAVDASAGGDFRDEGTRAVVDLDLDLRALIVSDGTQSQVVNLTPLTELVVARLGLAAGDGGESATAAGTLTPAALAEATTAVASAFGLPDALAGADVRALVAADGSADPAVNLYGHVLAMISGLSVTRGEPMADVLADLNAALTIGPLGRGFALEAIGAARAAGADVGSVGQALGLTAEESAGVSTAWQSVLDAAGSATAPAPSAADFAALGLTGLDSPVALALLVSAVRATPASWVSSLTRLQQMSDAAVHVVQVAHGAAGAGNLTAADLAHLRIDGTDGITDASLAKVQAALVTHAGDALLASHASLSAFVNAVAHDATPPTLAVDAQILTDSGAVAAIASGGSTRDRTIELRGEVADGTGIERVEVYDGTLRLGEATVADGRWQFTTAALTDGTHALTVRATDWSGNTSVSAVSSVTVDTAAPVIGSAAVAQAAENQAVVYRATASDAGGTPAWSLAGADAALLQVSADGVVSLRSGVLDFEGRAQYDFELRATDAAGNTASKTVRVDVTDVVEASTLVITGLANATVAENAAYAATAAVTGAIGAVTWSIEGADAALFSIDPATGALSMAPRNFEAPLDAGGNNVYDVTVRATDADGNTATKAVAVTVADLVETSTLVISGLADATVVENAAYAATAAVTGAIGAVVWSIEGADAARFAIDPATGRLSLAPQNFEAPADTGANNVYDVTVRATDADGNFATKAVAVTVTDVVETSTLVISGLADATVAENAAYAATAAVTGAIGTVTWSIEGADAALFSIDPATGALSMAPRNFEAPLDAGGNNVYDVTVRATDADGNSATQAVAVTVTDVVETSTLVISGLADATIAENAAYAATAAVTGAIGTVTWSIEGADAAQFSIDPATGALSMAPRNFEAPLDAGGNNVYDVTVRATDADGNTATQAVAVTVTDVVETSTLVISGLADSSVGEGAVYSATAAVSGAIGAVVWSIEGADAARFAIDPLTGALSLARQNFETPTDSGADNVYDVTVRATDADGNTATQAIAITVTNRVESLTLLIAGLSDATVNEGTGYSATATATGAEGAVVWSIEGLDAGLFTIDSATGALSMSAKDYEAPVDVGADNVYRVVVRATDADGNTATQAVAVTVANVLESSTLVISGLADASVAENAAYAVTAAVTGAIGAVVWSIEGADAARFAIDPATGRLSLAAQDFEAPADAGGDNVYDVTVRATDSDGNFATKAVSVTVTDVVETATLLISGLADTTVGENTEFGATAVVSGAIGAVTWSIEGADAALFAIDPVTGTLSMAARDFEAPLDAGGDNVYDVTVRATDADGNSATKAISVTVADVVETATLVISGLADATIGENTEYGATAVVSGAIGAVTWSIEGADAALFSIDPATGALSMAPRDFEAPVDAGGNNVYEVVVRATDADGNSATQAVAVTIADVVEAVTLTISGLADTTVEENAAYGATAAVAGAIGTVTWSIEGADAALFSIDPASGALSMAPRDFEAPVDAGGNNIYEVTVRATDADGNTATKALAVTITNVLESSTLVISGLADATVGENTEYGATAAVTGAIGAVTWTLEGDDRALFAIDPVTGALSMAAQDYEAPADLDADNVYRVVVRATDSDGNTASQVVAITVVDVVETSTLVISGLSDATVDEGSSYDATATVTGAIGAVTWSIEGADAALFSIDPATGALSMAPRDFEAPVDAGGNNVYEVVVRATDADGNSATQAVAVTIADVVEAVTLTISGLADTTVEENAAYGATAAVAGAIGTVTWSIEGADAALFSIDPASGALSMAPRDFEAPVDAGGNNIYEVTVRATDADGNTATKALAVTITNVLESSTLVISGLADATVGENTEYGATAAVTGAIGAVTWTLEGDDRALFAIDPVTGALSMAAQDYEAPADLGADNVYRVVVRATDGDGNTASQAVAISVTDVIEASTLTISGLTDATVDEGISYAATATVAGAIGTVTWTIEGADAGLFAIDAGTGALSLGAQNFESPVDAGADNVYDVVVRATDADGNSATQAVAVTIANRAESPALVISGLSDLTIDENTAYSAAATVSGALGAVTWSIEGADAGLFAIDAGTGAVSLTARDHEAPDDLGGDNVYDVTVRATDADGNTATKAVAITVADVDEAPTVAASDTIAGRINEAPTETGEPTWIEVGFAMLLERSGASDPDAGDAVAAFRVVSVPANGHLAVETDPGVFEDWSPDGGTPLLIDAAHAVRWYPADGTTGGGVDAFDVVARDLAGNESPALTVQVAVNARPTIAAEPDAQHVIAPGASITYDLATVAAATSSTDLEDGGAVTRYLIAAVASDATVQIRDTETGETVTWTEGGTFYIDATHVAIWSSGDLAGLDVGAMLVHAVDSEGAVSSGAALLRVGIDPLPLLAAYAAPVADIRQGESATVTFDQLNADNATDDHVSTSGGIVAFRITAVADGTALMIRDVATGALTEWAAGTNDRIDADHEAVWTPASDTHGIDGVGAFTVRAEDDIGSLSAAAQTVSVSINALPEVHPTVDGGQLLGEVERVFAIDELLSAVVSNAVDDAVVALQLVGFDADKGTLQVELDGERSAWTVGSMYSLFTGAQIIWTPAPGVHDMDEGVAAFSVRAVDAAGGLSAASTVHIQVDGPPDLPEGTHTIGHGTPSLSGDVARIAFTLADLVGASGATDPDAGDGDGIHGFTILAGFAGSLWQTAGDGSLLAIDPASDHGFNANDTLYWSPGPDQAGLIDAFQFRVQDNWEVNSANTATAAFTVNARPTLSTPDGSVASTAEDPTDPVAISFGTMLAATLASDTDGGSVTGFQVGTIADGSVLQRWDADSASYVNLAAGALIGEGDTVYWRPAADANGTLDAFTVRAVDDQGAPSAATVQLRVDVAPVDDAPTLSAFAPGGLLATVDAASVVTFADLLGWSDAADVDGTGIGGFLVTAVAAGGVLSIGNDTDGWFAFDPASDASLRTIDATHQARWTPDAGTAPGAVDAFSVVAVDADDPSLLSASAVTLTAQVYEAANIPAFTPGTWSTDEDTEMFFEYASLVDGATHAAAFQIVALGGGSLRAVDTEGVEHAIEAGSLPVVIGEGTGLYWTPAADANGTLTAFQIRALNAAGTPTAPIDVTVDVAAVDDGAPVLGAFSGAVQATDEDTTAVIDMADLSAKAVLTDPDGVSDVVAYRVTAVDSGTLRIGADDASATAWGAGNDVIDATHRAFWTPVADANGSGLGAFSVQAIDAAGAASAGSASVTVDVASVNDAPTLSSMAGAVAVTDEDTAVRIDFADLAAQSDAADVDNAVTAYKVGGVTSGTLRIGADAASATAWNDTDNFLVDATHHAFWTPAANANGLGLGAFTVQAVDADGAVSTGSAAVTVDVNDVNDAPTFYFETSFYGVDSSGPLPSYLTFTLNDLKYFKAYRDVDGEIVAYRFNGLASEQGTAMIGATFDAATVWSVGTNDTVDASLNLYWIPKPDVTFAAGFPLVLGIVTAIDDDGAPAQGAGAWTVFDGYYAPGPDLSPTPTDVVGHTSEDGGAVFVNREQILGAIDVTTERGENGVTGFVVTAVVGGTLRIGLRDGGGAASDWVPGSNDRIGYFGFGDANESTDEFVAYWTPDPNANGDALPAITVRAVGIDGVRSANSVTLTVQVDAVDDGPPVLSGFSGAVLAIDEDTTATIGVADLSARATVTDVDGVSDIVAYRVTGVTSGTLRIGSDEATATPWGAGNDLVDATHRAFWTPDADASGLGLGAFTVKAVDAAGGTSADGATVTVDVTAVESGPPVLSGFTGAVQVIDEDTTATIALADLAARAIASDPDGDADIVAYRVTSVDAGTLRIGADEATATDWSPGDNDTIDASHRAFWTPVANANGSGMGAFTVHAVDAGGAVSADSAVVPVDVTSVNDAPTKIGGDALYAADASSGVPALVQVTFDDWLARSNYQDVDGSIVAFKIGTFVDDGSLRIGATAETATAVVAGVNDTIDASHHLYWTPPLSAQPGDVVSLLTGRAVDDMGAIAVTGTNGGLSELEVILNRAPTLGAVASGVVTQTSEDDTAYFNSDRILSVVDASDLDFGDGIAYFLVTDVVGGSLRIGSDTSTAPDWAPGSVDRIDWGQWGIWVPDPDAHGEALPAVTVRAVDRYGAVSANAVTLTVRVDAVDDGPPVLGGFSAAVQAIDEDTLATIGMADLAAKAVVTDPDGIADVVSFKVTGVASGTLRIGADEATATAWGAGNDVIDATHLAFWQPAANANGLGLGAFTVRAVDAAGATSAADATVTVDVAAVDDGPPTLSGFTGAVQVIDEDTTATIGLADLAASAIATDPDGDADIVAYKVTGVTAGTLRIGADEATATDWSLGDNDTVDAANQAFWTPAANANGLGTGAFTVGAVDATGWISADSATVTVDVNPVNDAPTLSSMAAAVATVDEDTQVRIDFAALAAQADEADVDNAVTGFKVASVASGTLLIGTDAASATPWNASDNFLVDGTRHAFWTPAANANGLGLGAFTVHAVDAAGAVSTGSATATVNVNSVNDPPTLTSIVGRVIATPEDTVARIGLSTIAPLANEADIDGTVHGFKVTGVLSGSLRIGTSPETAVSWAPGSADVLGGSNFLYWTPPPNVSTGASGMDAFTIRAIDNQGALSNVDVPVKVEVTAVNDPPVLSFNDGDMTAHFALDGDRLTSTPFFELTGAIDSARIVDIDSVNFSQATVRIVSGYQAGFDRLFLDTSLKPALASIVTESFNTATGTLTLTNGNSASFYMNALSILRYTALDGATPGDRQIEITVTDSGGAVSNVVQFTMSVADTNEAPFLSKFTHAVDTTAAGSAVTITFDELLAASDATDGNDTIEGFYIVANPGNGTLEFIGAGGSVVTADEALLPLRVSADRSITWTPNEGVVGDQVEAFEVVAVDGFGIASGGGAMVTVEVTAAAGAAAATEATAPSGLDASGYPDFYHLIGTSQAYA